MLAGFQEREAAGSEHRGGGNKDLKDRYIMGRLGIPPGPGKGQPETSRQRGLPLPCSVRKGSGLGCLCKYWDVCPSPLPS